MPGRVWVQGSETREDFTGYERDAETGLLYAGARYYMPALGRFTSTDRFKEKYPSLTPYQYAANNPVNLIDVNGDSLDVNNLTQEQKERLYGSLQGISGQALTANSSGKVVPLTVSFSIGGKSYTSNVNLGGGSSTGSAFVNHLISAQETLSIQSTSGNTSLDGSNVLLNFSQIDANMASAGAAGLNPETYGVGLSTLHEAAHSTMGGAFFDPARSTNPSHPYYGFGLSDDRSDPVNVVSAMNQIRGEMGPGFGQRVDYFWRPYNSSTISQLWRLNGRNTRILQPRNGR